MIIILGSGLADGKGLITHFGSVSPAEEDIIHKKEAEAAYEHSDHLVNNCPMMRMIAYLLVYFKCMLLYNYYNIIPACTAGAGQYMYRLKPLIIISLGYSPAFTTNPNDTRTSHPLPKTSRPLGLFFFFFLSPFPFLSFPFFSFFSIRLFGGNAGTVTRFGPNSLFSSIELSILLIDYHIDYHIYKPGKT
jgi:hypothetical protein